MGNFFTQTQTPNVDYYDSSVLTPYLNFFDWRTDATGTPSKLLRNNAISIKQILEINDILDEQERISLVYLLAKDYETTLQVMLKLVKYQYEFKQFLRELLKSKSGTNKFIEALCVINNYKVLHMLGYEQAELEQDFSPHIYHTHIYINKTRKLLYLIMKKLTEVEKINLVQSFMNYCYNSSFPQYQYLEMYFAYLFKMNYASNNNLSYIITHLKAIDLEFYADLLSVDIIKSQNTSCTDNENVSEAVCCKKKSSNNVRRQYELDDDKPVDIYPMDIDNPGIVLIIENILFYEEYDEKYKDTVIRSDTVLEKRNGSEYDSKRLSNLFARFGYIVIHKTDLTHIQMLNIIEDVSHNHVSQKHSSFILVMLSHGLKNQIIARNCVPVNVDDIKKKINSKVLEGKPKVLIIQACQGDKIMRVNNSLQTPSVDIDGPPSQMNESSNYPFQRHIFQYWSTVPGYVSFRNWMIQALCDVLESSYRAQSFSDICSHVNHKIDELWVEYEPNQRNVMVPDIHSTLCGKFYLPPLKSVDA